MTLLVYLLRLETAANATLASQCSTLTPGRGSSVKIADNELVNHKQEIRLSPWGRLGQCAVVIISLSPVTTLIRCHHTL
jgi:hypothetical protein